MTAQNETVDGSIEQETIEVGNHGWTAFELLERTVSKVFETDMVEVFRLDSGQYLAKVDAVSEYQFVVSNELPEESDFN